MSKLQMIALAIPALTRFSKTGSQYEFDKLTVGGPALVEADFVDAKKAHSRVSSALTAYRKRTGDESKFTVRVAKLDDREIIGVWKLEDAKPAAVAPHAAEVQGELANV
jgi:hypothetical protein